MIVMIDKDECHECSTSDMIALLECTSIFTRVHSRIEYKKHDLSVVHSTFFDSDASDVRRRKNGDLGEVPGGSSVNLGALRKRRFF